MHNRAIVKAIVNQVTWYKNLHFKLRETQKNLFYAENIPRSRGRHLFNNKHVLKIYLSVKHWYCIPKGIQRSTQFKYCFPIAYSLIKNKRELYKNCNSNQDIQNPYKV